MRLFIACGVCLFTLFALGRAFVSPHPVHAPGIVCSGVHSLWLQWNSRCTACSVLTELGGCSIGQVPPLLGGAAKYFTFSICINSVDLLLCWFFLLIIWCEHSKWISCPTAQNCSFYQHYKTELAVQQQTKSSVSCWVTAALAVSWPSTGDLLHLVFIFSWWDVVSDSQGVLLTVAQLREMIELWSCEQFMLC